METLKPTITAIVLAKNEEERIEDCLRSLSWVSEKIVVDNGSIDHTVQIAKKIGVTIISAKEKNFSKLRAIGLKSAKSDWVLYIDADERVTPELQKEILQVMDSYSSKEAQGYYIKRNNYYLGHKWPCQDKMQRLFLRKKIKSWYGQLHETAIVDGRLSTLAAPMIHLTHRTLEEMVDKTNEWSGFEANFRFVDNHPAISWWRLLRVMLTGFTSSFISQEGWKAGAIGWIESMYQGYSMFITYAKLWEMQQKINNI